MPRHPHYELLKEWIEDVDRIVQWKPKYSVTWEDWSAGNFPRFNSDFDWRFKPEPKPDVVQNFWCDQFRHIWFYENEFTDMTPPNLKLTFDGETGELKSAEVIK